MNNIFNAVELKMLDELSKKGIYVGTKTLDKRAYLKKLIRTIYGSSSL